MKRLSTDLIRRLNSLAWGSVPVLTFSKLPRPTLVAWAMGKPFQKQGVRLRHDVGERDNHQRPVPGVFAFEFSLHFRVT